MVNPIANHVRLKTFGWRRCYTLKKLDEKKMWLHWTEPQYLWQLGEAPPKSCQKVAKCQRHFQPRKYGHFSTGNLVAWHRWWAHHDSAFATSINIMEYQCFMHIQSYTSLRYRCTVFCAFTCVYIYIYTSHDVFSFPCFTCCFTVENLLQLSLAQFRALGTWGDSTGRWRCMLHRDAAGVVPALVLGWSSVGDSQKDVENPPWM